MTTRCSAVSSSVRWGSGEVRAAFQRFFRERGHRQMRAAPLLPSRDPSLLFTNAGMVQFKAVFSGHEPAPADAVTTAQLCIRAGGKHNDLDNVGRTARHHTMFEMLGNFSFGRYFKEESIVMAWDLLTDVYGIDPKKLSVSVHPSDEQSAALWNKVSGIPDEHIIRMDDNKWSMGDGAGPFGLCSEIFFDQGQEVDGDRLLELWNLVFMQHQREEDGRITALPTPCVDTGMGLERIAAVLQGSLTNFDVDNWRVLIDSVVKEVTEAGGRRVVYTNGLAQSEDITAVKVIADHTRTAAALLADGVVPTSTGRGYVLRRIIRRALRFAATLGVEGPILCRLVEAASLSLQGSEHNIKGREESIAAVLRGEELAFLKTLHTVTLIDDVFSEYPGTTLLNNAFESGRIGKDKPVDSELAFTLYDCYGFPLDLTALIARERGCSVDVEGFEARMKDQKLSSRAAWRGSGDCALTSDVSCWASAAVHNTFTGFQTLSEPAAEVLALSAPSKHAGQTGRWLALDRCPFYAEGGGQVSDQGHLTLEDGSIVPVSNAVRISPNLVAIFVQPSEQQSIKVGSVVGAEVCKDRRRGCSAHHTATHALHAALRSLVSDSIMQAGSHVQQDQLRFDFNANKPLSNETLAKLEQFVNDWFRKDVMVSSSNMRLQTALAAGALSAFSDRFSDNDEVRVVQIDSSSTPSIELCGGTHVRSSLDAYPFKILSESSVGAGIRRITAVAGVKASELGLQALQQIDVLQRQLQLHHRSELASTIASLQNRCRTLEDDNLGVRDRLFSFMLSSSAAASTVFQGASLHVRLVPVDVDMALDSSVLRRAVARLQQQQADGDCKVLLYGSMLAVACSDAADAALVVRRIVASFGGGGGGSSRLAQGKLARAPATAQAVVDALLASKHNTEGC